MKLFELFATLSLDTSSFNDKVSEAGQQGKDLGNVIDTHLISKAVAWGNAMYEGAKRAVEGLYNFGNALVTTAADVQAERAQFESTFGDLSDAAQGVFAGIGEKTNIFATRLQNVGVKAFAQLKGSGLSATDALGAMSEYLTLAADAAAYYDMSLEDVDYRLRSFLRGNVEAGDMIGLFTSATQRDTYAAKMYGKEWKKLTEDQRQLLMLNVARDIYEQTGAIGQAARESQNFANITANLKEQWRQAIAVMGGPVLKSITPAIERLTAWIAENPEAIEKLGEVFGKLADVAADSLISFLDWMGNNGETVLAIFEGILAAIERILMAFAGQYELNTRVRVSTEIVNETGSQTAGAITQGFIGPDSPAGAVGQDISSFLSWIFGGNAVGNVDGRAVGMDYVPYDDYLARLHEGEAVLTKSEATAWRRGQGFDSEALSATVEAAIERGIGRAMAGLSISMDGQSVGNVVTKQVSRNIARQTRAERYGI